MPGEDKYLFAGLMLSLHQNSFLDGLHFALDFSGLLPPGTQFDLFRGTAAMKQDVDDMYPTTLAHTIKV